MTTEQFGAMLSIDTSNTEKSLKRLLSILRQFNNGKINQGVFKSVAALAMLNQVMANVPKDLTLKFLPDTSAIDAARNKLVNEQVKFGQAPRRGIDTTARNSLGFTTGDSKIDKKAYKEIEIILEKSGKHAKIVNQEMAKSAINARKLSNIEHKALLARARQGSDAHQFEQKKTRLLLKNEKHNRWEVNRGKIILDTHKRKLKSLQKEIKLAKLLAKENESIFTNKLKNFDGIRVVNSKRIATNLASQTRHVRKQISAQFNLGELLKKNLVEYFSVEKIISRMSFAMTAMVSWDILRKLQKSMKDLLDQTIKFESAMSSVFTLLDKNQQGFREILSKNVIDSMQKYGETIENTTRAMYDILSARIPPEWAGYVLDKAMMGAVAGFTDVKTAGDALTTVINSFGKNASEAGDVMDWFFQVIKYGKTTLEELAPNIGKVTSAASLLGISMEDVGASLSTMTQAGIKTDIAITSLRQLFTTLSAPTDKAKKIFEKYNIQLDIATVKKEGLGYAVQQLQGLTEEEIVTIAKSRRGFQALAVAMGNNAKYLENYHNIQNRSMASYDAYIERSSTLEFQLKKMKSAQIALNLTVSKYITVLGKPAIKILNAFIGALKVASGPIIILALIALRNQIAALGKAIISFGGGMAASAGPIGIFAAAILTITAIIIAYKAHAQRAREEMEAWTDSVYSNIKTQLKSEKEQLKLLKSIKGMSSEEIKNIGIKDKLNTKYKELTSSAKGYNNAIKEIESNINKMSIKETRLFKLQMRQQKESNKESLKKYTNIENEAIDLMSSLSKLTKLIKKENIQVDEETTLSAISKFTKRRKISHGGGGLAELRELTDQIEDLMDKYDEDETKKGKKKFDTFLLAYTELGKLLRLEETRKELILYYKDANNKNEETLYDTQREVIRDRIKLYEKDYNNESLRVENKRKLTEEYKKLLALATTNEEKESQEYSNNKIGALDDIYQSEKKLREANLADLKFKYAEEQSANSENNVNSTKARDAYLTGLKEWNDDLNSIDKLSKEQRRTRLTNLNEYISIGEGKESMTGLDKWVNAVSEAKSNGSIQMVKIAYNKLMEAALDSSKSDIVKEKIDLEESIWLKNRLDRIDNFSIKVKANLNKATALEFNQTKEEKAAVGIEKTYQSELKALADLKLESKSYNDYLKDQITKTRDASLAGNKLANITLPSLKVSFAEFMVEARKFAREDIFSSFSSIDKFSSRIKSLFSSVTNFYSNWKNLLTGFSSFTPLDSYDKKIKSNSDEAIDEGAIKFNPYTEKFEPTGSKGQEILDANAQLEQDKEKLRAQYMIDSQKYIVNQLISIWDAYYQHKINKVNEDYANDTEKLNEKASNEHRSTKWLEKEQKKIDAIRDRELKKAAEAQKIMAITKATINVAVAVTKALEVNPFYAATIAALGAIQIGYIADQEFAKGGIIGGKSHSQGGTQFVGSDGSRFEAEKDELMVILNKKSTGMLQQLSDLNVAGGGINFLKSGGIPNMNIPSMASGGIASPSSVSSRNDRNVFIAILDKLDNMETKVEINAKTLTDLDVYKKSRKGQRGARIYGS